MFWMIFVLMFYAVFFIVEVFVAETEAVVVFRWVCFLFSVTWIVLALMVKLIDVLFSVGVVMHAVVPFFAVLGAPSFNGLSSFFSFCRRFVHYRVLLS